ncbi:Cupin domain-containing protein [Lactobacillus crispatus]|uniref:Cupin domain-containing protein n=1 Tax=Lactobacillus crispatus TaxID=47770 RepID=A0AAW4DPI2_9LACO|nr:cupin domain-containing protein [Lactobacillus crispatus]MBI1698165.1 Cupin domain-containing protein [Lactobacillus crispatus]MBI1708605.1 Cupin domain-containing protein [Lactobacillus crispatus]
MAKNEEEVKNTPFGFGTSNDAYAKYFTGKSYLNPLATKANCNIANVNFEPGCINKWHEHTVPQILVCVAGEGWVQEEGKPAHKMTPGDVYIVSPNTRHWHGAAKDSWFSHLSIMADTYKAKTTWYEDVAPDYYNNLK